jgi:hypothetical protein
MMRTARIPIMIHVKSLSEKPVVEGETVVVVWVCGGRVVFAGLTIRTTLAILVRSPPVPVIVKVNEPVGA